VIVVYNANSEYFSYIMARPSLFSMRWWWWGPLCTRPLKQRGVVVVVIMW